ncbi:hypothetical protein G7Z17_g4547 [Cylindrodendrum hubeiense]|uniref:Protein kinase domain-containing protein n=1 Tax=Cylindrodendrum hubeiense TaxID=595255 RepID=A0A9P5LCJ0_9HYPO|nr:hypothetical protein G7Z17_g4547 [Cylindrodendrum hubeiense]
MSSEFRHSFENYVVENSIQGLDGDESPADYILQSALERYWQPANVEGIFNSQNPIVYQSFNQIIKGGFIRVFSILAFIGQPQEIGRFTRYNLDDQHLPLTTRPGMWLENPPNDRLYEDFYKYQWRFCPLEFGNGFIHKREIPPQMILPIQYEERLSRNVADENVAIVWKVKINDECKGKIPTGTVVFKVYQTEAASELFSTEADAYSKFPEDYWNYIVKCYGSFEQKKKRTIILEYAPGGTLLDFFEKKRAPRDERELNMFWTELLRLLNALYLIHEMSRPTDVSTWVLSAKKIAGDKNALAMANDGNRMYIPTYRRPESYESSYGSAKHNPEVESQPIYDEPIQQDDVPQFKTMTQVDPPDPPIPCKSKDNRSSRKSSQPPGTHDRSESRLSSRTVTFSDVYNILMKKDNKGVGRRLGRWLGHNPSEAMSLPGIQTALSTLKSVEGREQYFLIDDHASMQMYKDKVIAAARVLSYYVKDVDHNEMELYFASDVATPRRCTTSTGVESCIRKHKFVEGSCPMSQCLSSLLDHIWEGFKSSNNPVSVYVLTDGVWESGDDQLSFVIAQSARKLAAENISPQRIMVQFIRFGDEPIGYAMLKHLDDDLVEEHDLDKYDIVDTKHCDDHVPDILLGSISRISDAKETVANIKS